MDVLQIKIVFFQFSINKRQLFEYLFRYDTVLLFKFSQCDTFNKIQNYEEFPVKVQFTQIRTRTHSLIHLDFLLQILLCLAILFKGLRNFNQQSIFWHQVNFPISTHLYLVSQNNITNIKILKLFFNAWINFLLNQIHQFRIVGITIILLNQIDMRILVYQSFLYHYLFVNFILFFHYVYRYVYRYVYCYVYCYAYRYLYRYGYCYYYFLSFFVVCRLLFVVFFISITSVKIIKKKLQNWN